MDIRQRNDILKFNVNRAILKDRQVHGHVIVTAFMDGTVHLSGLVFSDGDRHKAQEIASKVTGVNTVFNNISVKREAVYR
jgi:osmotically-inducible protein OsmY